MSGALRRLLARSCLDRSALALLALAVVLLLLGQAVKQVCNQAALSGCAPSEPAFYSGLPLSPAFGSGALLQRPAFWRVVRATGRIDASQA